MRCTTAQVWRTPPNSRPSFVSPYSLQNNNFFSKFFYILFTELINNGDHSYAEVEQAMVLDLSVGAKAFTLAVKNEKW